MIDPHTTDRFVDVLVDGVVEDVEPCMRAAELRVVSDYLGLDQTALARYLDVAPRTVRRWIAGTVAIPPAVAEEVEQLEDYTARAVGVLVAQLHDTRDPAVVVYADGDPGLDDLTSSMAIGRPLPARWWQMVVARAVHEVPGVPIHYAHENPGHLTARAR